jgi:hypothetical protein
VAGFVRAITKDNIDDLIADYLVMVETIGAAVAGMSGLRLLKALKRDQVKVGPYPHVTLFEAANRIMTDMVILYGVKWILSTRAFPFEAYNVEYGNEDNHGFDLRASENGRQLVGEAFNVAPSFFQLKKTSMLKKLRAPEVAAEFRVLMFNEDAVPAGYKPSPKHSEFFVFVKVGDEGSYMVPSESNRSGHVPRTVT